MSEYLIDGLRVSREHPMYQESLEAAYANKVRPSCMCKPAGVPMYIAKLGPSEFLIKRMPNTGTQHHPDCDSYEMPSAISGRGDLDDRTVSEDQESGITSLKLDFSLSKVSTTRSGAMTASGEPTTAASNPKKMSILSLLHYLYDEAGLSKWSPRMANKRNWYVIRKHLLIAAANKVSRRNPLTDVLLIPEVFSVEQKDAIEARRKKFMGKLKPQQGKQQMGILIGELKSIEPSRFGKKLVIKHMPGSPFYISDQLEKRINKLFGSELDHFENESVHLLVTASFSLSAAGYPTIDTIALMVVDQNWLPFESLDEMELLERLCSEKRQFIKGLRYNLKRDRVIASALLTDTAEATAIYIQPNEEDDELAEEIQTVIDASELNNLVWKVDSGSVLQLPPPVEALQKWTNK